MPKYMLNAIRHAEDTAQKTVGAARSEADALLKEARLDVARRVEQAEGTVRTLKETAAARGKVEGEKEARALIEKAQKEIEAERKTYDARVKAAGALAAEKMMEKL